MATDRSTLGAIMDRMKTPAEPTLAPSFASVALIVPATSTPAPSVPEPVVHEHPTGFQGQTDRTALRAFMDRIRLQSAGRS